MQGIIVDSHALKKVPRGIFTRKRALKMESGEIVEWVVVLFLFSIIIHDVRQPNGARVPGQTLPWF